VKKILVISISSVAAMAFLLLVYYNVKIANRNTVETLINEKKMINILVAGSNNYRDDRYSFFSIVSINPENGNIGITFIPPSFRVFMDDDNSDPARIDEIEFSNFNRIMIQVAFRRTLRLNVPYFMEIYSPDVKRIVDLLEGIDIFILDQMKDQPELSFGVNYFDGEKTMKYINSVEGGSIYLKFDRAQDIISTLYYNKERYRKFFTPELVTEIFKSVKTNMVPQEIMKIGKIIFSNGMLTSVMLPGSLEGKYYVTDDIAYKIYEGEFLKNLVLESDKEPVTKIKILNGTDEPGLARKMRSDLIREGLNVVEFGTSSYQRMAESIIISRKGDYAAVRRVSDTIGIDRVYHIVDNTQLDNVLIIIGEDYKK